MTFEFRDAVRQDTQLLILLAGGTGTGKTESALRLATGIADGGLIAGIDTERGRMLHKADDYAFKHAELEPPFTPERYVAALEAAEALEPAVIVVDSGSHEYDGEGGVLEMQLAEHKRLGGGDNTRALSWSEPKQRHKKWRNALVRARPHVIVCHRAEDKIEIAKDEKGKTVVREKQAFTGAKGWIPLCERRLPYEATISLILTPDDPGVPVPVKLERRHQELVALDRQLDEATGAALASWAAGAKESRSAQGRTDAEVDRHIDDDGESGTGGTGSLFVGELLVEEFLENARKVSEDAHKKAVTGLKAHRAKNGGLVQAVWLAEMSERLMKRAKTST